MKRQGSKLQISGNDEKLPWHILDVIGFILLVVFGSGTVLILAAFGLVFWYVFCR